MPTSTGKNTIKMSSNEITSYIQKLEHAKLSNFHFGSIVIGATDQRENTRQKQISSMYKRLSKNRGSPKLGWRASEMNWDVPQIHTSCPRSTLERAPDLLRACSSGT